MVSTKELAYFLGIVLFLILGISLTIFLKSEAGSALLSHTSSSLPENETTYATVTKAGTSSKEGVTGEDIESEINKEEGFSRAENLKNMRAKIASNPELLKEAKSSPLFIPTEKTTKDSDKKEEESNGKEVSSGSIKTCAEQINLGNNWVASGISFNEIGGIREVIKTDSISGEKKTIAWLPALKTASGENCLNSSVVGIALDGSLIKNNENGLYNIFSKESLVGYARDGFPIYGLNNSVKTDTCGGTIEGGQYRYYLSTERNGVLGCFSGSPINSLGS